VRKSVRLAIFYRVRGHRSRLLIYCLQVARQALRLRERRSSFVPGGCESS
jgi:hypothetical protein